MLPFLKKKESMVQDGAEDEVLTRKPDDGSELSMMDAIAEDMIDAVHNKDKSLLKSVLEALVEHIKEEDTEQDEQLLTHEEQ